MKLERSFYQQDAYHLAIDLIGKVLCIEREGLIERYRIVETECYKGATDKASHAYGYRRTNRTMPLYLDGGHVYIYLIYGMYYMLNITASIKDNPEAVLIRALEPLSKENGTIKTNGPGKLCKALGIDKSYNEIDLVTSKRLYIEDDDYHVSEVIFSKRINIDYAMEDKDHLWRFYIKDNFYVSKK